LKNIRTEAERGKRALARLRPPKVKGRLFETADGVRYLQTATGARVREGLCYRGLRKKERVALNRMRRAVAAQAARKVAA
jgi:hypothetical protein